MNCFATVSRYASLVKFSHTIFALPFALVGYVYALQSNGLPFEWPVLVKVLLAMVLARNTAMGFNRWADRRIDAQNPRTSGREIPSGTISARNALWFVVLNAVLFVLVAWWINPLALALSPVALLVLTGYSLTKRFTAWCHIVLGVVACHQHHGHQHHFLILPFFQLFQNGIQRGIALYRSHKNIVEPAPFQPVVKCRIRLIDDVRRAVSH